MTAGATVPPVPSPAVLLRSDSAGEGTGGTGRGISRRLRMTCAKRATKLTNALVCRMFGLHWRNHLSVLQRHVRLFDDRLAAAQSRLDFNDVAEIAADDRFLKVQLAARSDQHGQRRFGWPGRRKYRVGRRYE